MKKNRIFPENFEFSEVGPLSSISSILYIGNLFFSINLIIPHRSLCPMAIFIFFTFEKLSVIRFSNQCNLFFIQGIFLDGSKKEQHGHTG